MEMLSITVTHIDGAPVTPFSATIQQANITSPILNVGGFAQFTCNPNPTTTAGGQVWRTSESYAQVTASVQGYADATILSRRQTILQGAGSITDGVVLGTYGLVSTGGAVIADGGNFAAPPVLIYIDSADFPVVNGLSPKLFLRAECNANNVAPVASFTLGLYPVTRPASSGGAGVLIYDYGTVVVDSTCAFTTPAADSQARNQSNSFDLPANGWYAVGLENSATLAANSHVHFNVHLQLINA